MSGCVLGVLCGLGLAGLTAAEKKVEKVPVPTVEPGLEEAVKWKWKVEAGNAEAWGIPVEMPKSAPTKDGGKPGASSTGPVKPLAPVVTGPPEESLDHVVVSGEALFLIGKKYGVTVEQIKIANQMERDLIKVGQKLRIPSRAEVAAMKPAKPIEEVKKEEAKPTVSVKAPKEEVRVALPPVKYTRTPNESAQNATQIVQTQAFLDRKLFSTGPIDGSDGSMHQAAIAAYKAAYPDELVWVDGRTPAVIVEMGGAYREYTLRAEDFQWIAGQTSVGRGGASGKSAKDPDPTWNDLSSGTFLPYRSAWEYVAERFHCSEGFLRRINSAVKSTPKVGTLFLVPNVEPFEIENAFVEPVRPEVDAAAPVVAKVLGGVWMEVWRGEKLVARVPLSAARPGLRGKGTWRILDSVARPKLVCTGEWANPPKPVGVGLAAEEVVVIPPPSGAVIPPGPNNPTGLFWVNLAKGSDPTPLSYGLHGTSIPGYLTKQESVGGFRLTNWDLVRVLRLLPVGTELKWE
jgi:LysM repeat protein/lipoprotein-anchoring transpeptidase ErfK/SrfK